MHSHILHNWIVPTFVITVLYVASFVFTFAALDPIQSYALPELMNNASVMFLPHGVRVLTAWLYRWRSVVLLTPGTFLTHAYLYGSAGFMGDYLIAPVFSVLCASVSFWFLSRVGLNFQQKDERTTSWRDIILAGCVASLINVLGVGYFFGLNLRSASAFLIGDVVGLIVSMFLLMLSFRIMRRRR